MAPPSLAEGPLMASTNGGELVFDIGMMDQRLSN
jgi:hypothetical protein